LLFAWAVVSPASARLILAAFVSLHDRRALRKHYKKLADSDSWVSREHDPLEAHKATLDSADHGGGLRRARLARTPDDGTQVASGLKRAKESYDQKASDKSQGEVNDSGKG
jgi:hypothetical protein